MRTESRKNVRRGTAIAVVLLGAATATTVLAAETRTYPGMSCRGIGPVDNQSTWVQPEGSIINQADAVNYVCPIARSPWVTGNQTGDVFVIDESTSDNVCCSSRAHNPGGSLRFTSMECTSGTASYAALHFDGPHLAGSWDTRFFLCEVPAVDGYSVSGIIDYRSTEN